MTRPMSQSLQSNIMATNLSSANQLAHLESAIYQGWVRHRRFEPVSNELRYNAFMVWLNLDQVDEVMERHWAWSSKKKFALSRFLRNDFFAADQAQQPTAKDLKRCVTDAFLKETGQVVHHICLLTNLRYFGYSINPVSFYYGYDQQGELIGILSEITNTPWDERFHYTLVTNELTENNVKVKRAIQPIKVVEGSARRFIYRFQKVFHVSPFNPLDMEYHWVMPEAGEQLTVHMETLNRGRKDFDATMSLERRPMTSANMGAVLRQFPLMTAKVFWGIYSNALRLWLKRAPFYSHPQNSPEDDLQNTEISRQENP